jgi:hypothetical protein
MKSKKIKIRRKNKRGGTTEVEERDPSTVNLRPSESTVFFKNHLSSSGHNDTIPETSYSKIIGGVVAAGVIATGIWALVKFKK